MKVSEMNEKLPL